MTDMSINQVCLRTLAHPRPAALETYLSVGGYKMWQNIIKQRPDPKKLLEQIRQSSPWARGRWLYRRFENELY